MWTQPPPPVDDRWVLHIAASPHQVDDILADLCIHHRAAAISDPQLPAYLAGRYSTDEPPAWMKVAQAELERRGHRTRWCSATCEHHPWPPRTTPPAPAGPRQHHLTIRHSHRRRTTLDRLTSGAVHHRILDPAQRTA